MKLKHTFMATLGGGLLTLSSSALAASIDQRVNSLEKDVSELNDRVDANELAATLSKVKFGLEFNTSVNNVYTKNIPTPNGLINEKYTNRWMMGLYLNMNADINEYTKFTGRLSMTKAFGDIQLGYPTSDGIGALDAGRGVAGGSAIFVERAYVDLYAFNKKVALTLGRLPGTDGPGSNLRNGSARMSTYPALAVNALGDGAVLTIKPYTNAALRFGYSKIYQPLLTNNLTSAGGSVFGSRDANSANLYFSAFETPFLPKSFGENLFMLTYINLMDYTVPKTPLTNHAYNVGNMQYVNVHLENNNMFNTGLNWFLSSSYYKGSAGKPINVTGLNTPFQFANGDSWAIHTGLRYDISKFKIGYEFFHGSKYWYAFSRSSINDPFNFRNTRGNIHDVYAIWQLDASQFFRLSYTLQQLNYSIAPLPVITPKVNITNQNVALAYIVRF